jgi:glutaredoxin
MKVRPFFVAALLLLLFAVALSALPASAASKDPKALEKFAQCLAKKRVTMYGAFWCQHCKEQKELFGSSFAYIPYVECSVFGRPPREQTQACVSKQIKKYPTWEFDNGERLTGLIQFNELAQKTGCPAP